MNESKEKDTIQEQLDAVDKAINKIPTRGGHFDYKHQLLNERSSLYQKLSKLKGE